MMTRVLLCDSLLQVFDEQGKCLRKLGQLVDSPTLGHFHNPLGIAFDHEGRYLVR